VQFVLEYRTGNRYPWDNIWVKQGNWNILCQVQHTWSVPCLWHFEWSSRNGILSVLPIAVFEFPGKQWNLAVFKVNRLFGKNVTETKTQCKHHNNPNKNYWLSHIFDCGLCFLWRVRTVWRFCWFRDFERLLASKIGGHSKNKHVVNFFVFKISCPIMKTNAATSFREDGITHEKSNQLITTALRLHVQYKCTIVDKTQKKRKLSACLFLVWMPIFNAKSRSKSRNQQNLHTVGTLHKKQSPQSKIWLRPIILVWIVVVFALGFGFCDIFSKKPIHFENSEVSLFSRKFKHSDWKNRQNSISWASLEMPQTGNGPGMLNLAKSISIPLFDPNIVPRISISSAIFQNELHSISESTQIRNF